VATNRIKLEQEVTHSEDLDRDLVVSQALKVSMINLGNRGKISSLPLGTYSMSLRSFSGVNKADNKEANNKLLREVRTSL